MAPSFYDFEVSDIDGKLQSLDQYRGKVVLVVNVASQCGFTSQYTGLEVLYREMKNRGLVILGFPCNQFGSQEPGNENEIKNFCTTKYDITFPLFAKVMVNGEEAHPLYKFLKEQSPGILGTEGIKWNFTKFLVDKQGKVVKRFAPSTGADSLKAEIEQVI